MWTSLKKPGNFDSRKKKNGNFKEQKQEYWETMMENKTANYMLKTAKCLYFKSNRRRKKQRDSRGSK